MSDDTPLRLLLREVRIIDDAARTRLLEVLPAGLSEQQFALLDHLVNTSNRNETPSDLARVFRVSRPAMTQLLGRMRRAGLVALRSVANDGRMRVVTITNAGRARRDEVFASLAADLGAISRSLHGLDLTALTGDLRRVRDAVEAQVATHAPAAGAAEPDR